jgi:RimJ/RimL family protein N-acetyltransferase
MKHIVRTDRVILREWTDADLEPFARMNADPNVMEFFPSTLAPDASHALAARIRRSFEERGFGWWALEIVGGASFAGFVGLSVPGYTLPFAHSPDRPVVEIGWRLDRSAWGSGYATEAARAALAHGFALGIPKIVSFTAVPNVRSQRVMERIGMVRRPDEDFDHPNVAEGHWLRRHVLYRATPPK